MPRKRSQKPQSESIEIRTSDGWALRADVDVMTAKDAEHDKAIAAQAADMHAVMYSSMLASLQLPL